jgi:hypothetical protein
VGRIAPDLSLRWDYARRRAVVLDLLARLPLERLISHRVPFADAPMAYRLLLDQPGDATQVVLTYDDESSATDGC